MMNCPCCNNEMEMGYLMCSNGERIYWQEKKGNKIKMHYTKSGIENDGGVILTNNNDILKPIVAWNCKDCKKILVEY